nr:hypothetical protein [Tanacetum cinerariifolium]
CMERCVISMDCYVSERLPYCKCSSTGILLGVYNLGVASPRALVHGGDKTSEDARSSGAFVTHLAITDPKVGGWKRWRCGGGVDEKKIMTMGLRLPGVELNSPTLLWKPTVTDVVKLYRRHEEKHGFSKMLRSLDCTDWECFGCPYAFKGQYVRRNHDLNMFILLEVVASQDLWI